MLVIEFLFPHFRSAFYRIAVILIRDGLKWNYENKQYFDKRVGYFFKSHNAKIDAIMIGEM